MPDVKTVGLLFCTAESNSEVQIQMAEEALDEAGIAHERYTVSSSNEIQQVIESMVGKVDAIYRAHRQHHRRRHVHGCHGRQ